MGYVSEQVKRVEDDLKAHDELLSEILATLRLPANEHYFENIPDPWRSMVAEWYDRWRKLHGLPPLSAAEPIVAVDPPGGGNDQAPTDTSAGN